MISRTRSHKRVKRKATATALILAMFLAVLQILPAPAANASLSASDIDGQTVVLINAASGQFLDADANGDVELSPKAREDDRWTATEVSPGVFTFTNVQYGRLLDADGAFSNFNVDLSRTQGDDSEWALTLRPNGRYEVLNSRFDQWLSGDVESSGSNAELSDTVDGDAEPVVHRTRRRRTSRWQHCAGTESRNRPVSRC